MKNSTKKQGRFRPIASEKQAFRTSKKSLDSSVLQSATYVTLQFDEIPRKERR
jgi:hypothetical protein